MGLSLLNILWKAMVCNTEIVLTQFSSPFRVFILHLEGKCKRAFVEYKVYRNSEKKRRKWGKQ